MKYLRSIIILAVLAVFSQNISAQTNEVTISKNVKPFRLGVKIGVPTIATINAEYLTPLLDDRVAISVDYMSLSPTIEEIEISYNNFEIGANIYLNNRGSMPVFLTLVLVEKALFLIQILMMELLVMVLVI